MNVNGTRKRFSRGVYNLDLKNIGKLITIQLRLYKPIDDSSTNYIKNEYVVCKEIVCTFYN